jgi:hypothetical protein
MAAIVRHKEECSATSAADMNRHRSLPDDSAAP